MLLQLENITGGYTQGHDILQGVNLDIGEGEAVGILGLNGSGKSTLARAVMNMLPVRSGQIHFDGRDISRKTTAELAALGISYMGQSAPVFDHLTVWENLQIAAGDTKTLRAAIERLSPIFPQFFRREGSKTQGDGNPDAQKSRSESAAPGELLASRHADKLSGGQRHQLALCLALVKPVKLLILDEPSAGLAPAVAEALYQILAQVRNNAQVAVMLIEQNVHLARDFCQSLFVVRQGRVNDIPT